MPERPPGRSPSTPRRPKTSSSARPATDGGRTIGRSTIASTSHLPRNRRRARTKASGRPRATVSTRLTAVVARLSHSASRTTGEAAASASDPSTIARATSATTGSPRNRANRAARATSERSPQRAGRPVPDRPVDGPPPARGRLAHRAGGRNPSARGSPARRARRTSRGTRGPRPVLAGGRRRRRHTSRGTLASSGTATVRTPVDGRGVRHVDDAGVALAELDLRHDCLDVVLLRRDVRRVGRLEVGRVAG